MTVAAPPAAGVWAKGEPPALGAGHQVGSIPTIPTKFKCRESVEANSKEEAVDIADHQTTDTVIWDEDWHPVDVQEDDMYCRTYVTEKAFE